MSRRRKSIAMHATEYVASRLRFLRRHLKEPALFLQLVAYIILSVIYFPKFLFLLLRNRSVVAFDWSTNVYGDFYEPILDELQARVGNTVPIIFFFAMQQRDERFAILRSGLPRAYKNVLDNKIVVSASASRYKKLRNTVRVQIFHGFAAFGSGFQVEEFIAPFDVLFLPAPHMYEQVQRDYTETISGKRLFQIGYPKLDYLIESASQPITRAETTLFYGPTYHREISSIFEFLPRIIDICRRHNYRLIIKLHPALYNKQSVDQSGGIDWSKRICDFQQEYNKILLLGSKISNKEQGRWFAETDIFLTDVSGIGFEFVLATGRPIIFLGGKLKIPLTDLRAGRIEKFADHAEVAMRGKIGPIASNPADLENAILQMLVANRYEEEIRSFRRAFTFNWGQATRKTVDVLLKLYRENEENR